ncbi:MAG: hypothetical protein M1517_07860 [Deltaproteobacteria bacterium]|nr:hypothetical protein [Deltaproteobacteria bacterium]
MANNNAPGHKFMLSLAICILAMGCSREKATLFPGPDTLNSVDRLYLSYRPPLAPQSYVIDIQGEPFEREILAASLQGIVNRRSASVYLVGDNSDNSNAGASELFWLNLYQRGDGVKVAWEGDLDDAVHRFSEDVNGYVLVSSSEPWTINAGTTLAALYGYLVAFTDERPLLESAGIPLKESLIGRWQDSSQCYLDLWKTYYSRMPGRGLGILSPDEYRLRDFLIQQGLLTVYGRPTTDDWDTIKYILDNTPQNIPVFGYLSQTGEEELAAVMELSGTGKYLIPSDTTPNLSFHVAVVPRPYTGSNGQAYGTGGPAPCKAGGVSVAIAISDGDNLVMALNRYTWQNYWNSSLRGQFPMGWSLSLSLESVAPAVAAYYLTTATANDELIGMLGIGYVHPSFYPGKDFFFSNSFRAMNAMNMRDYWTLDPVLYSPDASTWTDLYRYRVNGYPYGVLSGYMAVGGQGYFRTPDGVPVLVPVNGYFDTPTVLASRILSVVNGPPSGIPPVVFLSASSWSNSLEDMVNVLKPLESQGVTFLLPYQAFHCVP